MNIKYKRKKRLTGWMVNDWYCYWDDKHPRISMVFFRKKDVHYQTGNKKVVPIKVQFTINEL